MIHHHLKEAFERNNCYPDIVFGFELLGFSAKCGQNKQRIINYSTVTYG